MSPVQVQIKYFSGFPDAQLYTSGFSLAIESSSLSGGFKAMSLLPTRFLQGKGQSWQFDFEQRLKVVSSR